MSGEYISVSNGKRPVSNVKKRAKMFAVCAWMQIAVMDTSRYKHYIFSHETFVVCQNSQHACLQQAVVALLVPSCQQVWNKLLITCNNLVDIIRLVARLFQQVRYSHDITILLQPCVINLVTFLLYHDYIRLVRTTL
jgi:hypothetical protein